MMLKKKKRNLTSVDLNINTLKQRIKRIKTNITQTRGHTSPLANIEPKIVELIKTLSKI